MVIGAAFSDVNSFVNAAVVVVVFVTGTSCLLPSENSVDCEVVQSVTWASITGNGTGIELVGQSISVNSTEPVASIDLSFDLVFWGLKLFNGFSLIYSKTIRKSVIRTGSGDSYSILISETFLLGL